MTSTAGHRVNKFREKPKECSAVIGVALKVIVLQAESLVLPAKRATGT